MLKCAKWSDLGWRQFAADERGAVAIEYALIALLVSVAILTALVALGSGTDNMFAYIMSHISPALTGKVGH